MALGYGSYANWKGGSGQEVPGTEASSIGMATGFPVYDMGRSVASGDIGGAIYKRGGESFLDNSLLRGVKGGISSILGGDTVVNQYGTKTGEQLQYATSALQAGQQGLSQLSQVGAAPQNMYYSMRNPMIDYQQSYINPMMNQINKELMGSTRKYSSANTLQRQKAMMGIGSELAQRVGQERQLEMQGGLAGQQSQLSALGQITGASNNALNQSFFDTKVGKEGGLGGIIGSVIGAII